MKKDLTDMSLAPFRLQGFLSAKDRDFIVSLSRDAGIRGIQSWRPNRSNMRIEQTGLLAERPEFCRLIGGWEEEGRYGEADERVTERIQARPGI